MKAFTCVLSSDELLNFSRGGGNFTCLCSDHAKESIDARGLRYSGCLVTNTLLIGPVKLN